MRWWASNLRALSRHDPWLGRRLAEEGPGQPGGLELMRGSGGDWTLRRLRIDGRSALVHGQVDPLATAERALEGALPPAWLGDGEPLGVCALLGVGLGWPALAAAQRLPASLTLLLGDPQDGLFRLGLAHLDLGPLWRRRRLAFAFGEPDPGLLRAAAHSGVAVCLQDSVIEAFSGGRSWALACLRGLQAPKPTPTVLDGLPEWLGLLDKARMRGETL